MRLSRPGCRVAFRAFYANSLEKTHEENFFDSSCPSYKKNIELHAEELRNCTGKNTEAEWEVLHPSLYAEYIKAIRRRDLARTEYIIDMKNISKA